MSKRITTSSEEEYQREIATQAMDIKLRNTTEISVRKINLKKLHGKLTNYESGEFTIGKLPSKVAEDIIDLTGSHEEKDDW